MDRDRRLAFLRSLKLGYDPELPIVQRREEIAGLIRENQVVVVCGETGSGKSTQLPKICVEIGRGIAGMIGHTQPRRIAARSIAARLAEELSVPLGQAVGYKVRFDEKISPDSLVKLMTDGILLAESQTDKNFRQYDTIIIDEAHERSLNIDFLLGMMRRILPKRPDLKLIITSATIDAQRFAEHFSVPGINHAGNIHRPVPVIEVSGRTFPIDILYRSLEDFDDEDNSDDSGRVPRETDIQERAILAAVDELLSGGTRSPANGDVLIFLPTERDIFETAKALRHHQIPGDDAVRKTEILPLYARLPMKEQQKVFKTNNWRRIVLATNVAESSLTVPGIRYVIDTGTARISRYSSRSRTQRLPIEAVSQASADQRAGRCGRVGPGVCIRLFSEQDFLGRDRYTTPEIQRTNLASVILQTLSLRLGRIEEFPFLDPPRISAISDGFRTLFEIGAIDEHRNLTDIGWKLSRLPVDPRIGRMILAAEQNGMLHEMLIVAAALEIQDPRERPQEHQGKADAIHSQFLDSRSDYVSYLKLWDFYRNLKDKTSRSGLRKACQQHFLSFNRMKEWSDIHLQLLRFVSDASMKATKAGRERSVLTESETDIRQYGPGINSAASFPAVVYDALHRSILAGNLSGIAQRDSKFEYAACGLVGAPGGKFVLWPGSGVQKKRNDELRSVTAGNHPHPNPSATVLPEGEGVNAGLPRWIMAAERVETSRRYLRCVAQIKAEWIEPMAQHLVKRVYMEPHWNPDTGYVHAFEKVSLLGLVIVPKRRVNFGPIDPQQARDIFIQNALVEGQLDTNLDFFAHNELVLEEARSLQDKLRRPDILKPETARYQFYQERIPEDVYDKKTLEKWMQQSRGYKPPEWSAAPGTDVPGSLYMTLADLCTEDISEDVAKNFPDRLATFDGSSAKLEYTFAPGEEQDGLTVIVPKEGLRQLEPARLGWLVPGLVEQKIAALLKSLPKEIRRQIVPIPDTARELAAKISFGDGQLEERVAVEVSRLVGKLVTPKDFKIEQLPPELRMNIRVFDEENGTTTESRELDALRKEFGVKAAKTVTVADPQWNRKVTMSDFGDLPESIEIQRGGITLKAFPMVVVNNETDEPRSVNAGLADSLFKAEHETRRAVVELFYQSARRDIRTQVQWVPNADKLRVFAQPLPEFDYQQDVGRLLAARSLRVDEQTVPRTQREFDRRMDEARERLGVATQEVTKLIGPLLESFHQARLALEQNKSGKTPVSWKYEAWRDAKEQLRRLVAPGFLREVPWSTLKEFPRYFRGIPLRFEKLRAGGEAADRTGTAELAALWERYAERLELHQAAGIADSELEIFRWMVEEYRISLFAQRLGTAMKVSPQRLEKQWEKIRA